MSRRKLAPPGPPPTAPCTRCGKADAWQWLRLGDARRPLWFCVRCFDRGASIMNRFGFNLPSLRGHAPTSATCGRSPAPCEAPARRPAGAPAGTASKASPK